MGKTRKKQQKQQQHCLCGARQSAGEHGKCDRIAQQLDCLVHHQFVEKQQPKMQRTKDEDDEVRIEINVPAFGKPRQQLTWELDKPTVDFAHNYYSKGRP